MAKTEQGSSRMDTVLKMLLIAFVSLLAFSSGVYFGKQMSDSDHQLKALESDFNTQSTLTASTEKEEGVGEEDVAQLSDKYEKDAKRDVASAKEEPAEGAEHEAAPAAAHEATAHDSKSHEVTSAPAATKHEAKAESHESHEAAHEGAPAKIDTASSEAHEAAPAKTAAHAATARPDLSAAHRAAERVANNASPTTAKPEAAAHTTAAETRVPTSLPKTVGTSNAVEFTVQVASYPTSEAAKEHANELVKKGFPAFPVEATINGRTWFRVSVGSFKTMKDATVYRAQLMKQADLQNAIVQKITR